MAQGVQQHFSGPWKGKSNFKLFSHYDYAALFVNRFTFFSQFVKSWTSMEHDSNWEPRVGQKFSFQIFLGSISIFFLFEGEKYIEYVAMGRPGDPLPRSERHAVKIV